MLCAARRGATCRPGGALGARSMSQADELTMKLGLRLFLQVLMHDIDQLLGRRGMRGIARLAGIDHVLANVILNDLGDKPVQGAAAGGGLLQDDGAFIVRIDCAFDGFDLTAHTFEPIQKLRFLFGDVTHNF
jgi:hypothetical protein